MDANRPTEPLREEHAHLLPHIEALGDTARRLPELDDAGRQQAIASSLEFLEGHLLPHARAEEATLYPAWARLVGDPGAADTMVREHVAIAARINALATTPAGDVPTLQGILYGLHALITTHFASEEALVLDRLDAHPEVAVGVLQNLHH